MAGRIGTEHFCSPACGCHKHNFALGGFESLHKSAGERSLARSGIAVENENSLGRGLRVQKTRQCRHYLHLLVVCGVGKGEKGIGGKFPGVHQLRSEYSTSS